jgi:alpha,alpha-trehalase
MGAGKEIDASVIEAVVFDLDGVITRTADVHGAAWAQLFDDYLGERAEREGEPLRPFHPGDYLAYVDGKPRYDGVHSFLASRGIDLDWGSPDDPPELETVCGLGNRKNEYFLAHLRAHGVEPYQSSVHLVRELQRLGVGTALISSSRNVAEVLAAAGLSDLFPVIIDGNVAAELEIQGKPAPDVFIEAAARVGATPDRSAIVEDALSGVEAGKAGHFAMVIGVDRADQAEDLAEHGATVVVADLGEIDVVPPVPNPRDALPSALATVEEIQDRLGGRQPAVFLDYDGTLTPIVSRPDLAILGDSMRDVLAVLARRATVAVVSGRDVRDVRDMVGLDGIYYAGSHGLDIVGPDGSPVRPKRMGDPERYEPSLAAAEEELSRRLGSVDGVLLERKRLALAVHFRQVAEDRVGSVEEAVVETSTSYPDLRVTTGKKVLELRPNLNWDKGRAVLWLLTELGLDTPGVTPMYLGDDDTDEDAFLVIRRTGIGVVVGREGPPTHARWALADTDEVARFLAGLAAG